MTPLDTTVPATLDEILDEIDALSAANRETKDYDRERRLLELRHAATTHPLAPGPDRWPEPLPDPFPGATTVVEVAAADLDTELMGGAIQHHGHLLVRGWFGAGACAGLRKAIDKGLNGATRHPDTPNAWFTPFRPDQGRLGMGLGQQTLSVSDSPRGAFHFCQAYEGLARRVIQPYLGERPVMRSGKWTLRRIPPDIDGHWHQDGRFLGDQMRVVNAWTALTRCGPGTGAPGLELLPKSVPILGTRAETGMESIVIADDALLEAADGVEPASPVYEPGDVLLFDHRTCHRPGLLPDLDTTRYAIESWFFAPSADPYDDQEPLFLF